MRLSRIYHCLRRYVFSLSGSVDYCFPFFFQSQKAIKLLHRIWIALWIASHTHRLSIEEMILLVLSPQLLDTLGFQKCIRG